MNSIKVFSLLTTFFLLTNSNAQESYISVNNIDIYIEDIGTGQPIIFIPGWTMTTEFFSKQKSYFKKDFRFITFDPRSQGKSTKTKVGNNYKTHAADLKTIIKKLQLTNVILVGWSSGCATIYEYINSNGTNNIKQLIFIDEPPKWIGNPSKEWVYGTFEDYKESLKSLISNRVEYASNTVEWMLKKEANAHTKRWMVNQMLLTPLDATLSLYIDGMASDYNSTLKSVDKTIPLLFLVSPLTFSRAKTWLKANIPNAKIKAIDSHADFWERPEKFNLKLNKFLHQL